MSIRVGSALVGAQDVEALLLHKAALVEEWTSDDFVFECVETFLAACGNDWTPEQKQHLALLVKDGIHALIKAKRFRAVGKRRFRLAPEQLRLRFPSPRTFDEGGVTETPQTGYERDPRARRTCLDHFGFDCSVCNFNFEREFGELGRAFIHVHHLRPLNEGERATDPREDLRPVCPNCHAMLHKRSPPFHPDELRALRKQTASTTPR